jgi:outer membrane protein assembly factor BamB
MEKDLSRREVIAAMGLAATTSGCVQKTEGGKDNDNGEGTPDGQTNSNRSSSGIGGIISRSWGMELDRRVDSSPAVVEGVMYFGCYDGNVYAVGEEGSESRGCSVEWPTFGYSNCRNEIVETSGPEEPEVFWKFQTGDRVVTSPVLAEGNVYFGSFDGNIYSIDSETGEKNWAYGTDDSVRAIAGKYEDGVFYVGSNDGNLYALEAETGELIWKYETGGDVVCSPSVEDGRIYFGSRDSTFYCLSAETGEKVWGYDGTGKVCGSSPAIYDDKVYFGSLDSSVYCLDLDGEVSWEYETGDMVVTSPAVYADTVYLGSADKVLYSLDPDTGEEIWSRDMGGIISASPVPYEENILMGVHRGENRGSMYVVDSESGKTLGKEKVARRIASTPAVVDGTAYFGSDQGVHATQLSI